MRSLDNLRKSGIAALLLLAGCQKSFDDRYADAQKKIRDQAAAIDKDLADRASEAAMGQAEASSAATGAPPSPPSS
jgi:predicted nucleic acid-binding protein